MKVVLAMAYKDEVAGGCGSSFLQLLFSGLNHVVVDVIAEVAGVGKVVVVVVKIWLVFQRFH